MLMALACVSVSAAQEPDPSNPLTLPDAPAVITHTITWESIPDAVGSVRFQIPTCDECGGGVPAILQPEPEAEADDGWFSWLNPLNALDLGTWISWLSGGIWSMIQKLTCWLLFMLKIAMDIVAVIANVFLGFVNQLWRLLIFTWLSFRSFILALWSLLQYTLDLVSALLIYVFWILEFIRTILVFLLELIVLVVNLVLLITAVMWRIIALVGWLIAMMLGAISLLLDALIQPDGSGSVASYAMPAPLTEIQGHPILLGVRGIQEGILASKAGWMVTMLHVMAWIGFFVWIVKFLPGVNTKAEPE
jgi:hypothetical protein